MKRLLSLSAVLAANLLAGASAPSGALAADSFFAQGRETLWPSSSIRGADDLLQLAQAEGTEAPAAAPEDGAATEDEPIDQRAIDALEAMGQDLMALQEIAIHMEATLEQVLDSGQKIQFGGTAVYRVRRPDRLRLDVLTDTGGHQLFYNGQTITLYTPGQEYYGQAEAKATIRDTIEWMEDTYGIETPLADLFDWGTERAPIDEIEVAFPVGTSRVNGVLCGHYAFSTAETDWEVWIELGDRNLPRRYTITDRTQESLPKFEATLSWSTREDFDDYIFEFSPPADAVQIPITPLSEWAELAQQADQAEPQ